MAGGRLRDRADTSIRRRLSSRVSLVVLALFLLVAGACGSDAADEAAPPATTAAAASVAADAESATADASAEMAEEEMAGLEQAQAEIEAVSQAAMAGDDEVALAAAEAEAAGDSAAMAAESAAMAMEEDMAMEEAAADDIAESDAGDRVDRSIEGGVLEVSTTYTPSAFGRDVIYRAWVSVEAADVASATREAIAIVQGLGGFVFGQQTRAKPSPYSEIVFKVLPEDFSVALSRLSQVGELVDQQISADDVTERIVDLQSQIITAEASVGRLRSFLETATDLEKRRLL